MKIKTNHGFSTLEVLIGVLLSAPILATLALSIHNAAIWRVKLQLSVSEQRAIQRIESILKDGVDSADLSALTVLPRVHSNGSITLSDGTPNAIMYSHGVNRPKSSTDAITFASPFTLETQRVIRAEIQNGIQSYQSCPRYQNPARKPLSQYKSFLLIKIEGIYEAQLDTQFWKLDDDGQSCWISTVTATPKSMMATSSDAPTDLSNVRLIIPIDELYTLYIDQLGQLRYLHHQGEANIENQPLLRGLESIAFTIHPLGRGFALKVEIIFPSGSTFAIFSANQIGRQKHLNHLLNS